jgi:hypothetical protein
MPVPPPVSVDLTVSRGHDANGVSEWLLAGLRAHNSEKKHWDDTFQDSDDRVDPDDCGPRLSVTLKEPVGETYALPAAQAEQTNGRCPDTGDQSKGPQSAAGTPAPPDLLDPVVLRTMPPRVAAFMLYEPREPPPWRRQETLAQQAHREMIEDCRAWVGGRKHSGCGRKRSYTLQPSRDMQPQPQAPAFPTVGSPKYGHSPCICTFSLYY